MRVTRPLPYFPLSTSRSEIGGLSAGTVRETGPNAHHRITPLSAESDYSVCPVQAGSPLLKSSRERAPRGNPQRNSFWLNRTWFFYLIDKPSTLQVDTIFERRDI